MASFGNLPREVVEEIMSWLPADSLIRFKRVSKSWYALIENPDFVAKHLENTKKRPAPSMVLSLRYQQVNHPRGESLKSYDLWSLNLSDESNENGDHVCSSTELVKLPLCPYEHGSKLGSSEEVYHCDGIIVRVVDGGVYIILGNPVLQEFQKLPGPTFYSNFIDYGVNGGAFGYDSESGSYKIVRLFHHHSSDNARAKVLTLGTEFWREVEFPRGVNIFCSEGIFSRGFCYWLVEDSSHNTKLLCFDMSREEFHVLSMPKSSEAPDRLEWHQISGWDDGFVCFQMTKNDCKDFRVEVFVMDESSDIVNGCCSWTKRLDFGIEDEEKIEDIVKFWKSDELLMMDYSQNLVSYNLTTKRYRRFCIEGVGLVKSLMSFYWPLFYVKTLVSDFVIEEDGLDFVF